MMKDRQMTTYKGIKHVALLRASLVIMCVEERVCSSLGIRMSMFLQHDGAPVHFSYQVTLSQNDGLAIVITCIGHTGPQTLLLSVIVRGDG